MIQEKSTVLRPLENSIKKIEADIVTKDKELAEVNELIIQASGGSDSFKIQELSKRAATLKAEIDSLYEALEPAQDEYDKRSEYYEQLLRKTGRLTPKDILFVRSHISIIFSCDLGGGRVGIYFRLWFLYQAIKNISDLLCCLPVRH